MSFQPAQGIATGCRKSAATRSGIGFARLFARGRDGLRDRFSGRAGLCSGLKIALRGQHQNRRGRDQAADCRRGRIAARDIRLSVRRACRRRRVPPSPASVAATIRPAWMFLLSAPVRRSAPAMGAGRRRRRRAQNRRRGVPCGLDPGRLDRIGLDGHAQAAGQRGEMRRWPSSVWPAASPAQIAAITSSNAPMAPNA